MNFWKDKKKHDKKLFPTPPACPREGFQSFNLKYSSWKQYDLQCVSQPLGVILYYISAFSANELPGNLRRPLLMITWLSPPPPPPPPSFPAQVLFVIPHIHSYLYKPVSLSKSCALSFRTWPHPLNKNPRAVSSNDGDIPSKPLALRRWSAQLTCTRQLYHNGSE